MIYIEEFIKLIEVAKYVRISYYVILVIFTGSLIQIYMIIKLNNKIDKYEKYINQE